jgi:hypothetical protein
VREEHLWTPPEVRFLEVFAGLLMSAISRDRINVDLAAARQRETIGYLSSGVAHDLNNVLGVLDINIRYLHQKFSDGTDDPEVGQVLEEIQSALGQAKVVASGMLSLGRGGRMHPQDVPLGATIEEVVGICRPILPASIRVQVRLPSDLVVLSQAGFLQAAVLNLILNARDAMPDGGDLLIAATRRTPIRPVPTAIVTATRATTAPGSATIASHRLLFPSQIRSSSNMHMGACAPTYTPSWGFLPQYQAMRTGVFIVTNSSDMVGCTATVRSKSSFVAPILIAMPASWIISRACGATI